MPGNLAPFPYNPRTTPEPCKGCPIVEAGDWIQWFYGWPEELATRGRNLVYTPGCFTIHMVYSPFSDDATHQGNHGAEDQPVTYGGLAVLNPGANAPSAGNRRREYRIDPAWAFQAPWSGQLSLVAGGNSADDVILPVLIIKGFHPRFWLSQQAELNRKMQETAQCDPFQAMVQMACMIDDEPDESGLVRGPRKWPPPVVGTPQLVPATYVELKNAGGGGVALPFPDGAVKVESGQNARLVVVSAGNTLAISLTAGHVRSLGPLSQGAQVTNSVPATFLTDTNLDTLTFWSSLGG